jgi:hypothetical protein
MGRLLRAKGEENLPEAVLMKPAQVSDPGVYVARTLSDGPQYQRMEMELYMMVRMTMLSSRVPQGKRGRYRQ